jgi:NAD-dependent SIR2 family protein deacetylase
MFEWECPHCHKTFYSSYPARSEKMIKCSYCGKEMVNPYYDPESK